MRRATWLAGVLAAGAGVARGALPEHAVVRLGATALHHAAAVQTLALGGDGLLATAGLGNRVHLFDLASGAPVAALPSPRGQIMSLDFAPGGPSLALGGVDGVTEIWDTRTRQRVYQDLTHERIVSRVRFSRDGSRLVTVGRGPLVRVHDLAAGGRPREIPFEPGAARGPQTTDFCDLALAPAGDLALVTTYDGFLGLVDLEAGLTRQALRVHPQGAYGVDVSPDGGTAYVAAADGQIHVYDLPQLRRVAGLTPSGFAASMLEVSRDGSRLLLAGNDGAGHLLEVGSGRELARYRFGAVPAAELRLSPDGATVAGVTGLRGLVFDAESGVARVGGDGHLGRIQGLAWGPSGVVLSAGREGSMIQWEVPSGRIRNRWDDLLTTYDWSQEVLHPLAVHGDRVTYLSAVRGLGTRDLHGRGGTRYRPDQEAPTCLAAAAGRLAIGRFHGAVDVLEANGAGQQRLGGGGAVLHAVALDATGARLATGGADNRVRLYDLDSESLRFELDGHVGPVVDLAFSPDGSHLASGGRDSTVILWDLARGVQALSTGGETLDLSGAVAYSPDGGYLALGGTDGTVRLLSFQTGREEARLEGHQGAVFPVRFGPDGGTLVSGGAEGTVLVFDLGFLATGRPGAGP